MPGFVFAPAPVPAFVVALSPAVVLVSALGSAPFFGFALALGSASILALVLPPAPVLAFVSASLPTPVLVPAPVSAPVFAPMSVLTLVCVRIFDFELVRQHFAHCLFSLLVMLTLSRHAFCNFKLRKISLYRGMIRIVAPSFGTDFHWLLDQKPRDWLNKL